MERAEIVSALKRAREELGTTRKRLQEVLSSLSSSPEDTLTMARLSACNALVLRLEVAETEIQELESLLEITKTA